MQPKTMSDLITFLGLLVDLTLNLWVQEVVVAVDDEVRLLHRVARQEVGADALFGRELLQVVQIVDSGR